MRCVGLCALLLAQQVAAQEVAVGDGALLRWLDKASGATTDIELRNGATTDFGQLTVTLSECRYPVSDPASNAFAHLSIGRAGGDAVFDGWMIASSPALSALDDPRYDIWVLRCIKE
ncbi:MAG: DUF2155 domain-containing protein [Rhodobacteraceae bacterium]|nr:DUF2155 domain-containing protein [Paracoccaceae bacterium]